MSEEQREQFEEQTIVSRLREASTPVKESKDG